MKEAEELQEVTQLFVRMGAEPERAEVMAAQLLKRARQISLERQISFLEAAEDLLRKVIEARQGISPRSSSGLDRGGAAES